MNDERYTGQDRRRTDHVLEDRIRALESDVSGLKSKVDHIERAVAANTVLIEGVKRDTETLVTLLKSTRLLGQFIAWGAPIGAAIIGVLAYFRGERF